MNNIRTLIDKQIGFIYLKIEDLKDNDPHRTKDQARKIIQCGITRCYTTLDLVEAAEADYILTINEKVEMFKKIQDAHNELIKIQNSII